jgi:hypothetical protein
MQSLSQMDRYDLKISQMTIKYIIEVMEVVLNFFNSQNGEVASSFFVLYSI